MVGEGTPDVELPEIGHALAPVLAAVPRDRQPLLIATAERLAAARYREWAAATHDATFKRELLECATREEDIATRVERLYPNAAAIQQALLGAHPEVQEINRTFFAGRPLPDQFTIQARGERLGAATWRAFARHATDQTARETFLACALLEEASAIVLEHVVGPS
jgi:uncharacterized protein (DUF3084 family)